MLARTLILGASPLLLAGCGITGNFRHDPGYADFGALQHLSAESHVALSVGPLPLKLANWAMKDDEDVGPFLRELRAVRVYTFEGVDEDPTDIASGVKDLTAELAGDGWLNIAAVRDDSELTSVFLRPDKNFTHHGLVVVVQEPDEVVLVNLIGNIRLDFIDGYMADLNVHVPPLELDPATLETLQASLASRPAGPAAGTGP